MPQISTLTKIIPHTTKTAIIEYIGNISEIEFKMKNFKATILRHFFNHSKVPTEQ